MDWVAAIAEWVRHQVDGPSWLAPVRPYVEATPDWMLVVPAPVILVLMTLWTVGRARKTAKDVGETFYEGAVGLGLAREKAKVANVDDINQLREEVTAQGDSIRAELETIRGLYRDLQNDIRVKESLAYRAVGVPHIREGADTLLPWPTMITGYKTITAGEVARLPRSLIVADYGAVPFDDSRGHLAELINWARSSPAAIGRLYSAPGGTGKRRLALEAIQLLNADGWIAGLLTSEALESALLPTAGGGPSPMHNLLTNRGKAGIFLALDYAETRVRQIARLASLVADVTSGAGQNGPIRIVLTARSAGWFSAFLAGAQRHPFELDAMTAVGDDIAEDRRPAFLASACYAFAQLLEAADAETKAPGARLPLLDSQWQMRPPSVATLAASGNPLFLSLHALLRVGGNSIGTDGDTLANL